MLSTIEQITQDAITKATRPTIALQQDYVSMPHARVLNITSNRRVQFKHNTIEVPINIFNFSNHSKTDKVVIFDRQLNVIAVL